MANIYDAFTTHGKSAFGVFLRVYLGRVLLAYFGTQSPSTSKRDLVGLLVLGPGRTWVGKRSAASLDKLA